MKVIICSILFFFVSCADEHTNSDEINSEQQSLFGITYYDSMDVEQRYDTSTCLKESQFHPLYIGNSSDSIYLSYTGRHINDDAHDSDIYPYPDSDSLQIIVDTTQFITSTELEGVWIEQENRQDSYWDWHETYLKSYPVIIKNLANKTTQIGYGSYLPMIMEAQDSLGEWRAIQYPFIYDCGDGLRYPYLEKGQILITACKLFTGGYSTKLRLKYGWEEICYSNEFMGKIEYAQFASCRDN